MVAVRNSKHIFKKVPTGYPEPDVHTITDSSDTIDLENVALNGGFLVKTLALSIDPYLRVKMRHAGDDEYLVRFCICGGERANLTDAARFRPRSCWASRACAPMFLGRRSHMFIASRTTG
jgi:hypothetical protein